MNGVPTEKEVDEFKNLRTKMCLLMADSTNVERPGFSIPEDMVNKNIDEIIKEHERAHYYRNVRFTT